MRSATPIAKMGHEYAHIPDEAFVRNRAAFIETILGNGPRYPTETARMKLKAKALEDLLRSLHALRRGFPVGGFVAPKWSFTRPSRDVVHQICGPAGRAPISVMVRVS